MEFEDFNRRGVDGSLLDEIPNWVQRVADDGVIVTPAGNQESISGDIDYTAGDAFFPNGSDCPCLIEIRNGRPHGIVVYEASGTWSVVESVPHWHLSKLFENQIEVQMDDHSRFPLRVVSRLMAVPRGEPIRIRLEAGGLKGPWK